MSSLILLSNCSKQALKYHEFDNATEVLRILAPYLKSTVSSIRITAHSIAVHLGAFLSRDELEKLAFTPVEMDELVKALGQAIRSPNLSVNVFDVRISAGEILSELDLSLVVDTNLALLLKSDIFSFILSMLEVEDEDTMEAAINIVWSISVACHHEPSSEQLSVATPILKQLSTNKSSISNLAEYALLSLRPDLHAGMLGFLGCSYKHVSVQQGPIWVIALRES